MLVLDTTGIEHHRRAAAQERAAALRRDAIIKDIQSNTVTVEEDSGRDTSNLLAQMGRPITAQEMIRRLKLCNPNLHFEISKKNSRLYGIYIDEWERTLTGGWKRERKHICGMEAGVMPEFSVRHVRKKQIANPDLFGTAEKIDRSAIHFDEIDTFAGETRGWRTVLSRLLTMGFLKRMDVELHWGWTPTVQSKNWYTKTTGA